jgi:hypothetical protein
LAISRKKNCREFVYSQNADSQVRAICPISKDRLWVIFYPSANNANEVINLFDAHGKVEQYVTDSVFGDQLVSFGDIVLAEEGKVRSVDILQVNGAIQKTVKFNFYCREMLAGAGRGCLLPFARLAFTDTFYTIDMQSLNPLKCITQPIIEKAPIRVKSISGSMFVGNDNKSVLVYTIDSRNSFTKFSSYTPKNPPADARFCLVDGQEMVLVLVPDDNAVHIVDHCRGGFVRYLDTGSVTLSQPDIMYTDYDKHVWIGCDGGKVVVVDL